MTDKDNSTLDIVAEVSRKADRLARRMGAQFVLDQKWQRALEERENRIRDRINS